MTPIQILILVTLTVYAVYRQSVRHEVIGRTRFKLAIIYAVVGLAAGGYYLPPDASSWVTLGVSLLASVVVGIARGKLTRLYLEPDGRVFSQGTALTISLFLLLVIGKFAFGTWQYFHQAHPHGGFGEILLMIAAMVAMQAQIIWQRAQALSNSSPQTPPVAASVA